MAGLHSSPFPIPYTWHFLAGRGILTRHDALRHQLVDRPAQHQLHLQCWNKQTNKQISSLFKDGRHPDLHFLYESQVQVITALQSQYTGTSSPHKIGQIKAAIQFILSLQSALLGNLEGFVYWDFWDKKEKAYLGSFSADPEDIKS